MEGKLAPLRVVSERDEMSHEDPIRASFDDFTEAAYRRALDLAARNYAFASFVSRPEGRRHVLWRHDVDFSVHRALRLAEIEAEAGLRSTYFLYPHSQFYNLLSVLVAPKAKRIVELGHELGLHFDPTFYGGRLDREDFLRRVEAEKVLLSEVFGVAPVAVSFHLFGVLENAPPAEDVICGMVNAYGPTIRTGYVYCSDSNGVWRHERLFDVLERAEPDRLHVLTHPEWWSPEAMAPRARIQRCLDGQAAAVGKYYDELVDGFSRPNIR
jgi:hypothetical protein